MSIKERIRAAYAIVQTIMELQYPRTFGRLAQRFLQLFEKGFIKGFLGKR